MCLELNNISVTFGENIVLNDFSHCFKKGFTCIMAPSGKGKTTLLHCILGLIIPNSGKIIKSDTTVFSAVFQEDRLCENLTSLKNLKLVTEQASEQHLTQLLKSLGLNDINSTPVKSFSGGMKRRVALARALAINFDILILDEPFNGLDEENISLAIKLLREKTKDKIVIIATHNTFVAHELGAEIITI